MTKKKKKKTTDPHKESRAKKEEKGKDSENLQDMCKNHQGLQQKKKKGIYKIYYLWVTVITPDIWKILQEKPNGKLKMVLFHMKKKCIQIRSQHSPASQKWVEISHWSGKFT